MDFENTHEIKNLRARDGFYFFYITVDPEEVRGFAPYTLVKVTNTESNIEGIAVLEYRNNLKGVEVSSTLAHNLKIKKGSRVKLEDIFTAPPCKELEIERIELSPEEQTYIEEIEEEDLSSIRAFLKREETVYQKEETKLQEAKQPELARVREFVKMTYAYAYITDNHQFKFRGNWYQLTNVSEKYSKHFLILPTTKITLKKTAELAAVKEQLIGLEEPYEILKECLVWPKKYVKEFKDLNLEAPKGILLVGPPGVGKTHLVRVLAENTNYNFIHVRGPEILNKYLGGSEKQLRSIFEEAKSRQPSIIFFDEIESLGSKRSNNTEAEGRVVSQLLTLMDGIQSRGDIVVIAATNQPNSLDPALRRPGRFDKEIALKVPNAKTRKKLILHFLKDVLTKLDSDIDMELITNRTNGFVQSDIKLLVNELKLNVIRRKEEHLLNKLPAKSFKQVITMQDFETVMQNIKPSILRQYNLVAGTNTKLSQIKGYEEIKKRIVDQISLPLRYPLTFKNNQLKRLKGILLSGPPGVGKTSLARALASELSYNFVAVTAADINNKYVGQSENKIKELFADVRATSPCILFIDEIDAVFGSGSGNEDFRNSKVGQFLTEMDGVLVDTYDVIVIGTTNKLQKLEPALLRTGRFELNLKMDYPNEEELESLIRYYYKDLILDEENLPSLVKLCRSKKLVGSDIEASKRILFLEYMRKKDPQALKELEKNQEQKSPETIKVRVSQVTEAIELLLLKKKNFTKNVMPDDIAN